MKYVGKKKVEKHCSQLAMLAISRPESIFAEVEQN